MLAEKNIEDIKAPWTVENKTVLTQLRADFENGLSSEEAARRLEITGANKIEAGKKISLVMILINQFVSPFVLLLAIAAALSFYFSEWLDGIAIAAVLVINAVIGFMMEFQAERSMEALKKLTTVPARVVRNRKLIEIPSEEVVPGDILFVESGDMITADARVVTSSQMQTDESALTGESLPVEKRAGTLAENVSLAERNNMLYKGTFVNNGNGHAVVVHTGMSTELGSIAKMVQQAEQAATPLERKIQVFSKKLIWITVALIVIIFVAGVLNGQKIVQMLETSIALAVAAIPEGLPIVATLALAFGMLRMAKRNVIVKKLSSVETLGGTTVICTDKTGTLTQNRIEASLIHIHNSASRIEANPNNNSLHFADNSNIIKTQSYKHLLQIAVLCNTASFQKDGNQEKESGDPLEVGLL
ncbi:MAG TPA: HAD-IC family P-type ATPase, partial [Parafilimonas sp.]|nr:HAD-IC family P-type ATPase [Parafilimonas sp.]